MTPTPSAAPAEPSDEQIAEWIDEAMCKHWGRVAQARYVIAKVRAHATPPDAPKGDHWCALEHGGVFCRICEAAPKVEPTAEPVAWLRDQRDGYEGRETLDTMLIFGKSNPGKGINGATYSPVYLRASSAGTPHGAREPGFGLSAEQLQTLLDGSLKPEEIAGAPDVQQKRVRELVHWFTRLASGHANPKWAHQHSCELAYYIATEGKDRGLDLRAIEQAAFLNGLNVSPEELAMLKRIAGRQAREPSEDAKDAAWVPVSEPQNQTEWDRVYGLIRYWARRAREVEDALSAMVEAYERDQYKSWEKGSPDWAGALKRARAALHGIGQSAKEKQS